MNRAFFEEIAVKQGFDRVGNTVRITFVKLVGVGTPCVYRIASYTEQRVFYANATVGKSASDRGVYVFYFQTVVFQILKICYPR